MRRPTRMPEQKRPAWEFPRRRRKQTAAAATGGRNGGKRCTNKALAIQRVALGEGHPDTARTMMALGAAYSNLGQHGLAIEHFNKALAIQRAALGEGHPDTARTVQELQKAQQLLGQVRHAHPQHPSAHACNGRPARDSSGRMAAGRRACGCPAR